MARAQPAGRDPGAVSGITKTGSSPAAAAAPVLRLVGGWCEAKRSGRATAAGEEEAGGKKVTRLLPSPGVAVGASSGMRRWEVKERRPAPILMRVDGGDCTREWAGESADLMLGGEGLDFAAADALRLASRAEIFLEAEKLPAAMTFRMCDHTNGGGEEK